MNKLPPPHILSKSTFIRGYQCPKSLWMYKHQPELRTLPDEQQQAIFDQGTNVGQLAQGLFPEGIDASPETPYEYLKSVSDTAKYIAEGHQVIYEAAFQYDQVLAALDILVKKNGKWYGYEVKSSTSVSETYIRDAALQYYVITNSGIPLTDIFIVHINNEYVRDGEIDISKLFTIASVKKEAKALQKEIAAKIQELKETIKLKKCPVMDIGGHCSDPYDCDFTEHCWQHIPEHSVFDLRGNGGSDRAMELYRQGILKLIDIPSDFPLNEKQRMQVDTHISKELIINKTEIKEFLKTLTYPLYYMDFETYTNAVPEFDGCRPYQQIPFQYSLHIQKKKNGPLDHKEFLAKAGTDPREDFIHYLIEAFGLGIGKELKGTVIVYNKAFENRILNELHDTVDSYYKSPMWCSKEFYTYSIREIQSRIVDLMAPFRSRHYYSHEMKGSYSIKQVLPALIPEMRYEDMDISNGGMASQTFYDLKHETDPIKIETARKQLLEYCGLDTLAMVKIIEKLYYV